MTYEKQGIFYLLPNNNSHDDEYNYIEKFVCCLTKQQWRSGNTILIACSTKAQAIKINEFLWNIDPNSFLPHGLLGKNAHNFPITLYWEQCCYDNIVRDVLINLMQKNQDFFFNFNKIIDFVPKKIFYKKLARIRYKSYKNIGFQLTTHKLS